MVCSLEKSEKKMCSKFALIPRKVLEFYYFYFNEDQDQYKMVLPFFMLYQVMTKHFHTNLSAISKLSLCILVAPKCVYWQTMRTQMECHMMGHFICVYTVCY